MNELNYKDEIEALQEESDYEARGDKLYLEHKDDEARLQWAFYRPSGSYPLQVSDSNTSVAIMAFNHSRLGALKRFDLLNPQVKQSDDLRNKIRNRSRMLFRAMIDDDFSELIKVLKKYGVFFDLAYDQMINGRIWNEVYAKPALASEFLHIAGKRIDDALLDGLKRRLQPIRELSLEQIKEYLDELCIQAQNLHTLLKEHYVKEFEAWIGVATMHPLQKITLQKQIDTLKE